jgi:hypothetical protein
MTFHLPSLEAYEVKIGSLFYALKLHGIRGQAPLFFLFFNTKKPCHSSQNDKVSYSPIILNFSLIL